jgi:hypothetical protein
LLRLRAKEEEVNMSICQYVNTSKSQQTNKQTKRTEHRASHRRHTAAATARSLLVFLLRFGGGKHASPKERARVFRNVQIPRDMLLRVVISLFLSLWFSFSAFLKKQILRERKKEERERRERKARSFLSIDRSIESCARASE